MAIEKYRVHEVAKDFGLPTKTITEILTKYAETPKNHMQVLTDRELSIIFDYLTQHNQVSGIQAIFADAAAAEAPKAAPAPAAPAAPAVAPGTAGQLKLHDVPPKTAAMIMAIVADTMGKPLNELRFISIKEVK